MNRIQQLEAENKRLRKQLEEVRQQVLSQPSTLTERMAHHIHQRKLLWLSMTTHTIGVLREFIASAPSQFDIENFDVQDMARLHDMKQGLIGAMGVVEALEKARDTVESETVPQVGEVNR